MFTLSTIIALPGHALSTHCAVSVAVPLQLSPPCAGAGLSQARTRDRVPCPHVTSQTPHVPQTDHPPST